MVDLQTLFRTIEQLSPEEQEEVRRFIERRRRNPQLIRPALDEDPERRMAALQKAFEEFREGLSEEELDAIIEDMNAKVV